MHVSEEAVAMAAPREPVWLLLAIGGGIALELVWIGGLGWLAFKGVEYLVW
jgi:hypothetical protein